MKKSKKDSLQSYNYKTSTLKQDRHDVIKGLMKILLFVIVILAILVSVIWFIKKDNEVQVSGTPVQYYAGQKYYLSENATLSKDLDDKTILKGDNSEQEMSSIAIYIEDEDKIILPKDMVYYDPRNDVVAKIEALSEIIVTDKSITLKKGNKEKTINSGFLYDGEDYYIFLEPVTAAFNGYKVALSSLSYVEANYQNYVITFDYASKESMVEAPDTEIVVTTATSDYTVSLFHDSVENYKNEKSLLFSRPELLESLLE